MVSSYTASGGIALMALFVIGGGCVVDGIGTGKFGSGK